MAFEPVPFGKYTLYEKLAVGGMAIIYRARIQGVKGFQKDLVIKQILPQYSGMNDFIDMFIDEAKIAVNLNHANIVPVFELGEIDGQLYIAMEYVAGKDLQSILEAAEEKKLIVPPRIAAYIMIGVCRGLDYAHNKKDDATREPLKIVHRDISPNNVIVSYEGEIKVIDFGIAKASIKVSVTQFGTLKGKMIYMSPEQAAEKPLDARSDVFSAGILLYEMCTGKKPYGGDNFVMTQENVKKAAFAPPSQANPSLPPAIDAILRKAMALDTAERFENAFEFERALSDFLFSTGRNVYARDVAQFITDLFSEGAMPAEAPPRPEPMSKVPTITNIRNLNVSTSSNNAPVVTEPGRVPGGGPSLTPTAEHPAAPVPVVTDPGRRPDAVPEEPPRADPSIVDVPDEGPAIEEHGEFAGESVPPPDAPPESAPTPPPQMAARSEVEDESETVTDSAPQSADLLLGDERFAFEIPPPPTGKTEAQRDTVITKLPVARPPAATPVAPDISATPPPIGARDGGVVPSRSVAESRTNPSASARSTARVPADPENMPSWLNVEPAAREQTPLESAWDEESSLVTDEGVGVVPDPQSDEETAPGQISRSASVEARAIARTAPSNPASSAAAANAGAAPRRPTPTAPGLNQIPPPPPPATVPKPAKAAPPAAMQSPPRGTVLPPATPLPEPPWSDKSASAAGDSAKPGFLSRMGIGKKPVVTAPAAPATVTEITLVGQYDSPHDFLTNAYATYGDRRGLFLTTRQLDTKLGVDIPLEIDFKSPPAQFQVHGRVIWRRAKEGTSKGKKLPAGLAIEFVDAPNDDLEALFAYLGLP